MKRDHVLYSATYTIAFESGKTDLKLVSIKSISAVLMGGKRSLQVMVEFPSIENTPFLNDLILQG